MRPNETLPPSSRRHLRRAAAVSGMEGSCSPTFASTRETKPDHLGSVSTITVNDARSSLVGWRYTVSLQAVSGLDAAPLASTRLCVSPHPTT
jgi:hypothetical protein